MVTDYALLIKLPDHIARVITGCRKNLLEQGAVPWPYAEGLLLGLCSSALVFSGREASPVWDGLSKGNWRLRFGPVQTIDGITGFLLLPESFTELFFGVKGVLSESVFCGISGDPLPHGFLPLACNLPERNGTELNSVTDFSGSDWSKLIFHKVLLTYPLDRKNAGKSLLWHSVDNRTIIPSDKSQR